MVGLVLVSHSRALAEALLEFIQPMSAPDVKVAIAAGVGEGRTELGTDALEISEAIQSVYSPDGVLVMMDIGSAILSAELAVELLPPEMTENIHFSSGPFIEGSLAAVVKIGSGADLDAVEREAQSALRPKRDQLGSSTLAEPEEPAAEPPSTAPPAGEAEAGEKIVIRLTNQHGLHARPAARFVQTAARYDADVRVRNLTRGKGPVTATSLNDLATLGAVADHEIEIAATGPQATEALSALEKLIQGNFGEPPAHPTGSTPPVEAVPPPQVEKAGGEGSLPVSPGIAIGPLFKYEAPPPPVPTEPTTDPAKAWETLKKAIETTRQNLEQRRKQVAESVGEEQAAIFEAHILILQDPTLLEQVRERIDNNKENPAAAWNDVIEQAASAYRALEDPYLQQREADLRDVGRQVLFALTGKGSGGKIEINQPVVLFAEDLTPSETSQLDMKSVLGIMTLAGGGTSHSAILARAMGIPAVAGVPLAVKSLNQGTLVAFDGSTGKVWIEPNQELQAELHLQEQVWREKRDELKKKSQAITITKDGQRVEVFANIGSAQDAQMAVQNGAEGVGLLRTEFLFLARQTPPSEAEQFTALDEIGAAMGDRPVTVRTLDVGGDKELPYLQLPHEANPFLGVRAIRMSLRSPELFLTQLRAILRAGTGRAFRIMFPMIATVDEIWQARKLLEQAHLDLDAEKTAHAWPVETGIMVEIPSAAILSPVLAREVDFFSIGTNDLTQYTLAAERGSPELVRLADAMNPAVLQLITNVAKAAHAEGKWVGVCGELAGDPEAAAVLIGLGVDELSLNAGGIPTIKDIVRRIDTGEAKLLGEKVLACQTAPQVRELAKNFLATLA